MSSSKFTKEHKTLPTEEQRLEMATFINHRKGIAIGWLLRGSVYRLMAIHKIEKEKQAEEQSQYHARQHSRLKQEPKPLKPFKVFKDGILWVLGDDSEYTQYYD